MVQLGAMLSKLQKVSEEFNVAVLMTNQVIYMDFAIETYALIVALC